MLGNADVLLWPGLARWIPLAALDHLLDDGQDLLGAASRAERAASAAADNPHAALALLDAVDVFSGAAQALAQIADDMSVLASLPRIAVAASDTHASRNRTSLMEALPGSGADKIRALTDVLGVSAPDAMAVLRGRRRPMRSRSGVAPTAGRCRERPGWLLRGADGPRPSSAARRRRRLHPIRGRAFVWTERLCSRRLDFGFYGLLCGSC